MTISKRVQSDPNVTIGGWKNEQAKKVAQKLLEKYGQPQDSSLYSLTWFNNGFWTRTTIKDIAVDHNFPMPHEDFLWQWTSYPANIEKIGDCFKFDGSVLIDPTFGEIGGRCHMEEANFVTTNMVYEIMMGKRDWQEAKQFMAYALLSQEPKSYLNGLVFSPRPIEESRNAGEITDISNADLIKAFGRRVREKIT